MTFDDGIKKKRSEIKKAIVARKGIISDAEKRIAEDRKMIENNKQWVTELEAQLGCRSPIMPSQE